MMEIIGVISLLVILPGIICTVAYKSSKNKTEHKVLEEKRKILELEVELQKGQIKLLEEENKKYDKIIYEA